MLAGQGFCYKQLVELPCPAICQMPLVFGGMMDIQLIIIPWPWLTATQASPCHSDPAQPGMCRDRSGGSPPSQASTRTIPVGPGPTQAGLQGPALSSSACFSMKIPYEKPPLVRLMTHTQPDGSSSSRSGRARLGSQRGERPGRGREVGPRGQGWGWETASDGLLDDGLQRPHLPSKCKPGWLGWS